MQHNWAGFPTQNQPSKASCLATISNDSLYHIIYIVSVQMLLLLVLGKLTNSTFRLWYRYVITPTYELDVIHALTLV